MEEVVLVKKLGFTFLKFVFVSFKIIRLSKNFDYAIFNIKQFSSRKKIENPIHYTKQLTKKEQKIKKFIKT